MISILEIKILSKEECNMLWVRLIIVGFFSISALSLMSYQSIEIFHAIVDFIKDKHQLK